MLPRQLKIDSIASTCPLLNRDSARSGTCPKRRFSCVSGSFEQLWLGNCQMASSLAAAGHMYSNLASTAASCQRSRSCHPSPFAFTHIGCFDDRFTLQEQGRSSTQHCLVPGRTDPVPSCVRAQYPSLRRPIGPHSNFLTNPRQCVLTSH